MADVAPTVCFVTMVRDDDLFLRLWIRHYERIVPRDHLFILMDGQDREPPPFAAGCQILRIPRQAVGSDWDTRRWKMLSDLNTFLLNRYDIVALNDVDEILVVDPASGIGLIEAMSKAKELGVISPFALEVVHRFDICPDAIDLDRPILRQRPHVRLNGSYNKPCITSVPVRWSVGGHYSDFPTLNLDSDIYLFHLNRIDLDILKDRQAKRFALARSATEAGSVNVAGGGWKRTSDDAERFLRRLQETGPPEETDFTFSWQRKRMTSDWEWDKEFGVWRHARFANRRTYKVPERFHDLF
ncbi:MAG: hypothetical protein NTW20_17170 [Rhodobacterales bacterium]|nr:hypothetical protein [Rhodobacterales bacterium]